LKLFQIGKELGGSLSNLKRIKQWHRYFPPAIILNLKKVNADYAVESC
jgi:hypothetical protein